MMKAKHGQNGVEMGGRDPCNPSAKMALIPPQGCLFGSW